MAPTRPAPDRIARVQGLRLPGATPSPGATGSRWVVGSMGRAVGGRKRYSDRDLNLSIEAVGSGGVHPRTSTAKNGTAIGPNASRSVRGAGSSAAASPRPEIATCTGATGCWPAGVLSRWLCTPSENGTGGPRSCPTPARARGAAPSPEPRTSPRTPGETRNNEAKAPWPPLVTCVDRRLFREPRHGVPQPLFVSRRPVGGRGRARNVVYPAQLARLILK
jgi:hypothetical protein